ncbi:hypothetical protein PMIN06_011596 [Paraphaeosphaeria minitans]
MTMNGFGVALYWLHGENNDDARSACPSKDGKRCTGGKTSYSPPRRSRFQLGNAHPLIPYTGNACVADTNSDIASFPCCSTVSGAVRRTETIMVTLYKPRQLQRGPIVPEAV